MPNDIKASCNALNTADKALRQRLTVLPEYRVSEPYSRLRRCVSRPDNVVWSPQDPGMRPREARGRYT